MARRRFTISRAFVLLVLGIGIGAVLFLSRRLSPDAIKRQVEEQLARYLQAPFELADVALDLDRGVALEGFVVRYPDGGPAIAAERVVLTVDHRRLIGGAVHIRQVDIDGLRLHLRHRTPDDDLPGLPGVFRPPLPDLAGAPASGAPPDLPLIRIRPGDGGSRVTVDRSRVLASHEPLVLACEHLEASPDGPRYDVRAGFSSPFLGPCEVHLSVDTTAATVDLTATVEGVTWSRADIGRLAPGVRAVLPPIELGGRAGATVHARAGLDPLRLDALHGEARLDGLSGAFGNLHTGEAEGLPFGLVDASCTVSFDRRRVRVPDFAATYVSPDGRRGAFGLDLDLDLRWPDEETDFVLTGRGIRASTPDLRLLLPADLVESVVDAYLPAGTFDFEIDVQRVLGVGERVVADLTMRDGEFNYAGPLDELTNRRFGFRYPLDRCEGRIRVETNIPTPHGLVERFELSDMRGFNRIAQPEPDGPRDVEVAAEGRVLTWTDPEHPDEVAREDADIAIVVRNLPIDAKLASAFAATPEGMPYRDFDLSGWADRVEIRVRGDAFAEEGPTTTYDVMLRDCSIAYEDFPLRVEGVHGRVISSETSPGGDAPVTRTMRLEELTGTVRDGGTVTAAGVIVQTGDAEERVDLSIVGRDLVLGRNVGRALRLCPLIDPSVSRLWYDVRPFGMVDALVEIGGDDPTGVLLRFDGRAGLAGYGPIECPITELRGDLRYADDRLELPHLEGRLEGAPVVLGGTIDPARGIEVTARATALPLTGPVCALAASFAPDVEAWVERLALGPDSRLDLAVDVTGGGEGSAELRSAIRLDRLALGVELLGAPVEVTGGPVLVGREAFEARDLRLDAGDERVTVREARLPRAEGREASILFDARGLAPDGFVRRLAGERVRDALGDNLRLDLSGLQLRFRLGDPRLEIGGEAELRRHEVRGGAVEVLEPTGRLRFDPLRLHLPEVAGEPLSFTGIVHVLDANMNLPVAMRDFSGELRISEGVVADDVRMRGAVLGGEALLFGRHVDRLSFNVALDRDTLSLGNIDARLYEGRLRGAMAAHRGEPAAFDVRLTIEDVELAEMFEEEMSRDDPMSGRIDGAIELRSPSGDVEDLAGRGEVRVREGQLFRVPGLRGILAVLGRVTPLDDDPRFRQARAEFTIDGETLHVPSIHLSTALNDIHANGTISIYGDLDLEVEPQVTRLLDLPRLLNIPVLSTLRDLWHKTAYGIRLEGTVASPQIRLRPLPFLGMKPRPFVQSAHAGRPERMRPRTLP